MRNFGALRITRVMERIWESFGVEIERRYPDMDDNGSGMSLKVKEAILNMI